MSQNVIVKLYFLLIFNSIQYILNKPSSYLNLTFFYCTCSFIILIDRFPLIIMKIYLNFDHYLAPYLGDIKHVESLLHFFELEKFLLRFTRINLILLSLYLLTIL